MGRVFLSILLFLVAGAPLGGCRSDADPVAPPSRLARLWATSLGTDLGWEEGRWGWTWASPDGDSHGTATLEMLPHPRGWWIQWHFQSGLPDGPILLQAHRPGRWHSWQGYPTAQDAPLPLPRVGLDSRAYPHLLALLQDLTRDRFQSVVTHWPEPLVPVRLFPAVNDSLDLGEVLREAMAIWNAGPGGPFFREDSLAAWGVRLVHFPDRSLRPPAAARITRLDAAGRPLRVHIEVGNDYHQPWHRRYALRAMVHELGHGLLLWGHSLERDHCLWGAAPPLVAAPSLDERKAARWWRGLPQGLDLKKYGPASGP